MTIIGGVLALSIVVNHVCIQELNASNKSTSTRDRGLVVTRSPDQTFILFDAYEAGIDAKEMRARLHWVAVFLKKNPNFNGFIVSYAGQSACADEAIKRAKTATQFLIKNEGVRSKQLKIVDAGYRSNWVIEFWYGPMRAKGQPSPTSAIDRSAVKITKACSDIISLH